MTKISLNLAVVETFAVQAFKETCFLLGREFTQIISDPSAFEGFPNQDIVDTGLLRASQQLEFPRSNEGRFSWNTEYALYVHEGYTLQNGTEVEGRPWTEVGLERFDVEATFNALLEAKLK